MAFVSDNLFLVKAGFRQVGTSGVMAYALHQNSHPSRHLPVERDPVCRISLPGLTVCIADFLQEIPYVVQPTPGEHPARMLGM
jgi:hypothetical protein